MDRKSTVLSLALMTVVNSAAQSNILNNGGFETGLMCYQDWIWSYTYQDYKGDYKFALSSDAHSGAYSLEIACKGTDCMRAAIYSDNIPITTPGQSYKISLYSKCPANTYDFVYVPDTATGNVGQTLTCNGNWAPNTLTFQTDPAATTFFFYIFNADVSWLHVDDVAVTYTDGTAPAHVIQHPGLRSVGISGQNFMVDGKPYLSLGYTGVEYSDLPQAAANGANTINGFGSNGPASCFNTGQPDYLDRLYNLGMNFIPDSTTTARLMAPPVFTPAVQTFAPHLAVLGWSLADEPDEIEISFNYIPPTTLGAEYTYAKTATSLPLTFNSQHAGYYAADNLQPYAASADFWMAEPYGSDFDSVVNAVSVFNTNKPQPIWLYQDAIDATLIVPKAYWAIINGVTGIHYFDWDGFKADGNKMAATKQVFTELNTLKSAIFGTKYDSSVTATAGIGTMARYDPATDAFYLLTVNPLLSGNVSNIQANFSVQGLRAGTAVTVMFENRTITSVAGGFSDAFTGASRHVYLISNYLNSPSLDKTPPTWTCCTYTGSGSSYTITFTAQDTGSGLQSILPVELVNATVSIPKFTVGTTSPVSFSVTESGWSSYVGFQLTDEAGNISHIDPCYVDGSRQAGEPAPFTVSVDASEGVLTVVNRSPGLKNVQIEGPIGSHLEIAGLKDGETRVVSIASILPSYGLANVTITPLGKPGGQALFVFASTSMAAQ